MSRTTSEAPQMDRKFFSFELKEVDLERSEFAGYSAAIGNRDLGNDIIEPGAFDKTIRERVNSGKVKLLDNHNSFSTQDMWGTMLEAEEVEWDGAGENAPSHKLLTRFSVSRADEAAQTALRKIGEGHLDQLSIGFRPLKFGFEADDEDGEEDPRMAWLFGRGIRKIQEIQLWETSLVIWAMNPEATIVQDNVDRLVDFARKASAGGHHVSDESVKQTIGALRTLIKAECPVSAPDGVKEHVRTAATDVSRAVAQLEAVLSRPQRDALVELAEQFKQEHGPADRQTFGLWVADKAWPGEEVEPVGGDEDDEVEGKALSRARRPAYDGTEEADWSAPTLEDYVEGLGFEDVEEWDDLTSDQKQRVVEHTLLGTADEETFGEANLFPVVNPGSGDLNANALRNAAARATQADISAEAAESVQDMANSLLDEEFGDEDDEEAAADAPVAEKDDDRDEAVDGLTEAVQKLVEVLSAARATEDDASETDGEAVATADLDDDGDAEGKAEHVEEEEAAPDITAEEDGDRPKHFLDEDALAAELGALELMDLELVQTQLQ